MIELSAASQCIFEVSNADLQADPCDLCRDPASATDASVRVIDRGRSLYREGCAKRYAYRVEQGIFCLTAQRTAGPPDVLEMVFPGGILGLGFLETHSHSAVAVVSSRVSLIPLENIAMLCELSPEMRDRQATAVEREFEYRRHQVVGQASPKPLSRVVSFLLAIASMNAREGRDPQVIGATLKSGDVAAFLGIDVDTLALALAELQSRRLILRDSDGGIRLDSVPGLAALVE